MKASFLPGIIKLKPSGHKERATRIKRCQPILGYTTGGGFEGRVSLKVDGKTLSQRGFVAVKDKRKKMDKQKVALSPHLCPALLKTCGVFENLETNRKA